MFLTCRKRSVDILKRFCAQLRLPVPALVVMNSAIGEGFGYDFASGKRGGPGSVRHNVLFPVYKDPVPFFHNLVETQLRRILTVRQSLRNRNC